MHGPELVSFTFTANGYTLDLSSGPTHNSRETSGVWFYDDQAWKIFPNMKQWKRVYNVYQAATDHGLPISSYKLHQGTILDDRKRKREGFALAVTYITYPARFFALKNGTGLMEQFIQSITDDGTLSRIEGAFSAAVNMGLKDPQGFINQDDPDQPIVFIDLHTSSPAARLLEELRDYVRERRTILLQ